MCVSVCECVHVTEKWTTFFSLKPKVQWIKQQPIQLRKIPKQPTYSMWTNEKLCEDCDSYVFDSSLSLLTSLESKCCWSIVLVC